MFNHFKRTSTAFACSSLAFCCTSVAYADSFVSHKHQRASTGIIAKSYSALVLVLMMLLNCCCLGRLIAQTGTFIDRQQATDLRVVSYNVLRDTIFPDVDAFQAVKFIRVVQALDPDVLNLQEIYSSYSAADVVALLNGIAPLSGGATWFAHKGGDNVIASKYPLSLKATNTIPRKDGTALALVDLPDNRYEADLYVMNNHFTCCNSMEPPEPLEPRERSRQQEADALVNWMRDARTIGEFIDLPYGTPMLVVGDLNIINDPDILDPLGTLLGGDIYYEETYGADSPPDWDGTSLSDAHPLHNGSGPDDYTWRSDIPEFDGNIYPPGRLDYILYTDSVIQEANKFVLNTVDMTTAERLATGLQTYDITVDLVGARYDHLPVVVDFRIASIPEPIRYS